MSMAEATTTEPEPELMTQAAYAMLRGISKQAIGKHVASGLIVLDGGKVNRVQANAALAQLDPARSKAAASFDSGAPSVDMQTAMQPSGGNVRTLSAFQESRARREAAEARKAELDLERDLKTLVDRDGVRRGGLAAGRALHDSLMGSAVRIGPGLVGISEPGEMVRRLEGEMRSALAQAVKALTALLPPEE